MRDWKRDTHRFLGTVKEGLKEAGLKEAAAQEARSYIGQKLTNLLYPHFAHRLLAAIPKLDKRHVSSDNRLYVLRWLTGEEADDYFVYKQVATRSSHCGRCGRHQDGSVMNYPQGYLNQPICDDCLIMQTPAKLHVGNTVVSALSQQGLLNSSPVLNEIAQVYPISHLAPRDLTLRENAPPPNPSQLAFLGCKCPLCGQASLSVLHLQHWCTVAKRAQRGRSFLDLGIRQMRK